MSKALSSPSAGEVEPAPDKAEADYGSGLAAADGDDRYGPSRPETVAELSGHMLLARGPPQQGRRSLFRR